MKFTAGTGLFLSYNCNNFQAPKFQAVLAAFFMRIIILHVVVVGGLNIGV